jgi:hypothetical protein
MHLGYGYGNQRTPERSISIAFDRLLLAHLQFHLPHSAYEVAQAQEPFFSRFLLFLLHEFLLAPQPIDDALPADLLQDSVRYDGRARPGALHAARLIALHVLANPALQSGCEESLGASDAGLGVAVGSAFGAAGTGGLARLTREVTLLGPRLVDLVMEVLRGPAAHKQLGLQTLTSLARLWLLLLQPWKAPRLYTFYQTTRSPTPKLDTAELGGVGANQSGPGGMTSRLGRYVDVSLLGLEPDMPGILQSVLNIPYAPEGLGAPSEPGRLINITAAQRLEQANLMPLIPGAGDAQTWRSYVVKFHNAYCLFEAFLLAPAFHQLSLALCRNFCANRSNREFTNASHIKAALRAIAQMLLCFTDPALLRVLAEVPNRRHSLPATVVVSDGELPRQIVSAVSLTWAALLAAHKDFSDPNYELNPLLCAISRQLTQAPLWAPHGLPQVTESVGQQQAWAGKVLQDFPEQTDAADAAPKAADAGAPVPSPAASFIGSEWQRPKRGGEVELLLLITYWLAIIIDRLLGRELKSASCGVVPQTEWPRLFANWKLTFTSGVVLVWAVLW